MQTETSPNAVCIGLDTDEPVNELSEALAPFRCVHYRDVYRALARISRDQPALVIVDVAWLPTVAFEFFDILAHSHADVPVLVAGPVEAEARIRDALARGARSRATAEAIAQCVPTPPPIARAARAVPAPVVEPLATPPIIPSDTLASAGNVFDAELDRRLREQLDIAHESVEEQAAPIAPDVEELAATSAEVEQALRERMEPLAAEAVDATDPGDEEPADTGTRVPWLRYTDRPRRTPPQRTPPQRTPPAQRAAPAGPSARTAPTAKPRVDLDAPLLTEAELAALLSPLRRGRQE